MYRIRLTLCLLVLLLTVTMLGPSHVAAMPMQSPAPVTRMLRPALQAMPTPAPQKNDNTGSEDAVWVAVAIFAAVGGGTAMRNRSKQQ